MVSTNLGENWETGREHEQPPVLHPFNITPSLSAAYAIRGSSAFTPMQSQTILRPEFLLQTSQSVLPPNMLSPLDILLQQHRHTTTQLANSLLCHPTWSHTSHAPSKQNKAKPNSFNSSNLTEYRKCKNMTI